MRVAVMFASAVLVAMLGAVQLLATLAVRDDAGPLAWVSAVPQGLVAGALRTAGASVPMPARLRALLAHAAFAAGDGATARAALAHLPPSIERAELEGAVLEEGGDLDGAAGAYLQAGDVAEVERRIDALEMENRPLPALALAKAAVARMAADRGHGPALADLWWKLGQSEQLTSYLVYPKAEALRQAAMRRALDDYGHALALAPLQVKYLLSSAAEEQNLHEYDAAITYYTRAQLLDPQSPDPLAGLGEIALVRNDRATAQAYLQRALVLDAASVAADRLRRKLAGENLP